MPFESLDQFFYLKRRKPDVFARFMKHEGRGEKAVIRGPSLVGQNVVIEDNAAVTASILWPNAVVETGAEVEDSIVADSFRVGRRRRLSHCIAIDRDLKVGDVHGLMQGGFEVSPMRGFSFLK